MLFFINTHPVFCDLRPRGTDEAAPRPHGSRGVAELQRWVKEPQGRGSEWQRPGSTAVIGSSCCIDDSPSIGTKLLDCFYLERTSHVTNSTLLLIHVY